MRKTNIILLAAGNSKRFHDNKLLHKIQDKPMIQRVMEEIQKVNCEKVIVVTQYEEINRLARLYGYDVVINENPQQGISYSIKLGMQEVTGDQVIFLTGDLAYLKATTLNTLIAVSNETHIVCAAYQGQPKNPVLFPAIYFPELKNLTGDIGGKVLIKKYPNQVKKIEINMRELHDIDTVDDVL